MLHAQQRPVINFEKIPPYLKQFSNWAFYTARKAPITLSAVAKGWPADGWNHSINGSGLISAGAKSNDPNSWGLFDDCHKVFENKVATAGSSVSWIITGPTVALQEDLGIVVIDLDDPERSLRDKVNPQTKKPLTDAEKEPLIAAALVSQREVLTAFKGHYIERSASGKGYHIFVRGKLPHTRYRFGFHGSVFTAGQFINMTGNIINDCEDILEGQSLLDDFVKYFSSSDVGLLIAVNKDDDPKSFEDGEILDFDYGAFGRRIDLSDEEVLEKLSKGMRAVYDGGAITNDHSGDTLSLLGDLDKITGSAEQIERLMRASPRMLGAGIGNDGRDRWEKFFRLFRNHLVYVRRSNDRKLSEWHSKQLTPERHEEMRRAFERLTSVNDPSSLAYKEDQARRAKEAEESEAQRVHDTVAAKIKEDRFDQRLKGREYTKYAKDAMEILSCGIHSGYLEECLPPGRMGELAYYTYEGMHSPFIKFAIPATFAAIAGIIARKYKFRGDGLNLLIVLLGKTGVGKTQSIDAWHDFSADLRKEQHLFDRYMDIPVTSKQGFHSKLEERPCFTWVKDECANQLQNIISPKPNDTAAELLQAFTNMLFDWSKVDKTYWPSMSRTSERAGEQPIENLCVSTYWGTTQSNVRQFFTKESVQSGIVSRMIFINHSGAGGISRGFDEQRRTALPQGDTRDIVKQLMANADDLDKTYTMITGKLPDVNTLSKEEAQKIIEDAMARMAEARLGLRSKIINVQMDVSALELAKQLFRQVDIFIRPIQDEQSVFPEYYVALNRLSIIAVRFAAIMAVVENPHTPVINYAQLAWAIGYILQCTCNILSSFDTNSLGVELADAELTVVRIMKSMLNGSNYVKYGELVNRMKQNQPFRASRDPRAECKRCLDDMIEHEMIQCVDKGRVDPAGRPVPGPRPRLLFMNEHPCWTD